MATRGTFNEIGMKMQAEISKMGQSIPKATWDVGKWLKRKIKERTLRGKGMDDKPFDGYKPFYARRKGSTHVNLFGFSTVSHHGGSHMLDLIQVKSEGSANSGNARYNAPARRFIPVKGSGGMFLAFKETTINLEIGGREVDKKRAGAHQAGKHPKVNMPRRPFMGLARSEHRAFEAAFQRQVYRPRSTSEEIDIVLSFGGRGSTKR